MVLIPEVRAPFNHIGDRVAHTGASFATGVAYLVIILMLLTVIAEIFLVLDNRGINDDRSGRLHCNVRLGA